MTNYFLRLPLRNKLFLTIFFSALLVALPGFFAVLYIDVRGALSEAESRAQSEMRVLSQDLAKIINSSDDKIAADVVAKLRLLPGVYNVFLYDREGLLVFRYEKSPSVVMPPPNYLLLKEKQEMVLSDDLLELFLTVRYMGEEFGGVFLRTSVEQYDQHLSEAFRSIIYVILAMLVIAYFLALWLHRYFSEPITSLSEKVRDIAEKRNFFEDVTSADANEIGDLYRGVGELLGAMRSTQQKLHQSEIRLEAVINIAGSALISIDENHRIILFNRQAEHVFGYSLREVIGRPIGMLLPERFRELHEKSIDEFANKNIEKRMAQERSIVPGLRKNGEEFPVEASISQILLGEKKMFTVALADVTQRQQTELELDAYRLHLEDVVEGRTSELREKNNELEAFSYSIAHDLRAPLRSITSFSQILLEDAGDKLSEDERDHLSRVVKAGQHMADLIDGILNLARIGRSQMSLTQVDLSVLVTQAKTRLSQDQPGRVVDWDVQPGLVARGDSQLLSVVIDNLVNNAWKYTKKLDQAKISFGLMDVRGKKTYFIRDNGAGFDMKHAKNLFGVFQRLHTSDDFDGTGVGLATVKRVIHRHNGAIWAEAAVDAGATFYFTLPD